MENNHSEIENNDHTANDQIQANNPELKNKNYLPIIVIVFFVLLLLVFIIIGLTSKEKAAENNTATTTTTTTAEAGTPEQQLANALKTVKTDSSETALFELGMAYINNNIYNEAIVVFHRVLKINPNNSIANNNLGFSYGCVKNWDNGIKYCQIALDLDPAFQLAKNNLAWMLDEKAKASINK